MGESLGLVWNLMGAGNCVSLSLSLSRVYLRPSVCFVPLPLSLTVVLRQPIGFLPPEKRGESAGREEEEKIAVDNWNEVSGHSFRSLSISRLLVASSPVKRLHL